MSPTTDLHDYAEAARSEERIGFMCLTSVRELDVPRSIVVANMRGAGLDVKLAPQQLGNGSAFRRACSRFHQRTIEDSTSADITRTVMLREVVDDKEQIVRRLVVETRDGAGGTLAYDDDSYDIIYDKVARSARYEVRQTARYGSIDPAVSDIAHRVIDTYKSLVGTVSADHIRSVITRVAASADAIAARDTGGVWFIPVVNEATAEALETFAAAFGLDGTRRRVQFDAVPLPRVAKYEQMVLDSVENANEKALTSLQAALTKALADGAEPKDVARLQGEYAAIKERTDKYRALLSDQLDVTSSGLTIVDAQMAQLLLSSAA